MVVRVVHRQRRRGQRTAARAEVAVVDGVGEAAEEFLFAKDGSALRAVHDGDQRGRDAYRHRAQINGAAVELRIRGGTGAGAATVLAATGGDSCTCPIPLNSLHLRLGAAFTRTQANAVNTHTRL